MKKDFALIDITLAIIILGLTTYTLTSIITNTKDKGSKLLLEHIKDIETNALVSIKRTGTYTFDELKLSIFLQETDDIKCESYTITNDKVISASNCIYDNKMYCYENSSIGLCGKKEYVNNDNSNNNNSDTTTDDAGNPTNDEETNLELPPIEDASIQESGSENVPDLSIEVPANVDASEFMKTLNSSKSVMSYNDIINIEIPDKYNTGVRSWIPLTPYQNGVTNMAGMKYIIDTRSAKPIILLRTADLAAMSGEYVIENVDFSAYNLRLYTVTTNNNIHIKFRNCRFDSVKTPHNLDDHVTLEFEYCNFAHVDGSNITLNYSRVGGGSSDGINPFKNFYVYNSYIADISGYTTGGESHYDGMQIYGSNMDIGFLCHDVHFYNTRFEMPYLIKVRNGVPSSSYVNAPIMVALEYNNATNISFEKVYANGGGYSIYNGAIPSLSISNVSYKDVYVGYGSIYGVFYPMKQSDILNTSFTNVGRYDKPYISSVWKDGSGVHVITTNETLVERKMRCVTNVGNYDFVIPAHPKITRAVATQYTFESLPYDLDELIPNTGVSSMSCYDITNTEELTNNNLLKIKNF